MPALILPKVLAPAGLNLCAACAEFQFWKGCRNFPDLVLEQGNNLAPLTIEFGPALLRNERWPVLMNLRGFIWKTLWSTGKLHECGVRIDLDQTGRRDCDGLQRVTGSPEILPQIVAHPARP
jgi:hypothetical protein